MIDEKEQLERKKRCDEAMAAPWVAYPIIWNSQDVHIGQMREHGLCLVAEVKRLRAEISELAGLVEDEYIKCGTCGHWVGVSDFADWEGELCNDCWENAEYECPIFGCSWRFSKDGALCGIHEVQLKRREKNA